MKAYGLLAACAVALVCFDARGEDSPESDEVLILTLTQDANFGFYLGGTGTVPIDDRTAFRVYGDLYTNSVFATDRGTGAWVEAGAGVEWLLTESLTLGVQLGLSNGTVIAGSTEPIVAEGLVPGVDVTWSVSPIEVALFAAYYAGIRRQSDAGIDYLITGGTVTGELARWVSVGALYELIEVWVPRVDDRFTEYQWLGPVATFQFGDNAGLLLSGGWDFADRGASEFYRAQLTLASD
ncbi:MAG: DUF6733 family protein [Myxococcota bacterium]